MTESVPYPPDDPAEPDRAAPRPRRARRVVFFLTLALTAACVAAVTAPRRLGLNGTWPIVLLISFRTLLAVTMAVLAAVLIIVAIARGRGRRLGALAFAAVFAAGTLGQWATVTNRITVNWQRATGSQPLRVLSFNTSDQNDPAALAQLISGTGSQVAVLPETTQQTAAATTGLLAGDGLDMQVFVRDGASGHGSKTALLVDRTLGSYMVQESGPTAFGSFVVTRSGAGTGPVAIGAVHTVNPVHPTDVARWRAETDWVISACNAFPGMIMAGDLNATVDHPAFDHTGNCLDAGVAAGQETLGTWPSWLPPILASPIDHVLVDSRTWWVTSFELEEDTAGSDHRPILAEFTPRVP